jgi:Fe-S-cluster-containing dehydrogenase component
MKKRNVLLVDVYSCTGCYACEVACKQEHDLPVGHNWITVRENNPLQDGVPTRPRYVVAHCMHCNKPPCLEPCPVDAIEKRKDGIVLVKQEDCIGCKKCIEECPFGVMQFDEDKQVAYKCDMCIGRLEKGLQPACVSACTAHCIHFGEYKDVLKKIQNSRILLAYRDVIR